MGTPGWLLRKVCAAVNTGAEPSWSWEELECNSQSPPGGMVWGCWDLGQEECMYGEGGRYLCLGLRHNLYRTVTKVSCVISSQLKGDLQFLEGFSELSGSATERLYHPPLSLGDGRKGMLMKGQGFASLHSRAINKAGEGY